LKGETAFKGETASSVKVNTSKLDYLVDMVGELVIAQSLIRHDPELAHLETPRLVKNFAQLGRITLEVQKTAMSMRMVPLHGLFQKMQRVLRDLSRKMAKNVEMEMSGGDVEVDRNVVEAMADPLLHMIRNAIDHGIEAAEERVAAGKPAAGRIALRARHEAGHIVVELADDGKGLDRERILRKARERGLIGEQSTLSEEETFHLILEPGFSTAEQVTEVSGRGVGMDVVRRQVQKLRGRIEIRSEQGKGTMFLVKLPLTLAIIDGLVVGVGNERFIVPIFSVREMLRPSGESIFTAQGEREMAMVRERLLPLVRLYERFGVEPKARNPWEAVLIVTESQGRPFCLMVDALIGKQEVVIKALGETMKNIPGVAGGAILGDGRVGLILDPEGIFGGTA
jgi:two-component system chemotaxis sensor kinase CheA